MTPRLSRLLAVGILLVLPVAALAVLVLPIGQMYADFSTSIDQLQAQIERYRGLAGSDQQLKALLERLEKEDPAGPYFVKGATPALALATMQQYLKQVVEKDRGQLVSTQTLPNNPDQAPDRIGLKVHMKADIAAVLSILHRMETSKPMLFLDNLVVTANPAAQSLTGAGQPGADLLDIRFDLSGYVRSGP